MTPAATGQGPTGDRPAADPVGQPSPPAYRKLSLWHDQVAEAGDDLRPRPCLTGDATADVAIVGAGFTGLWTAYYLLQAEPGLRVVVVDAEIAGFGASGRNGGWCSAEFSESTAGLVRRHGREAGLAMRRAMAATVDEVGRVVAAEGIDCGWAKGGMVALARSPVQLRRAEREVAEDADFDRVDGLDLLDSDAAWGRLAATRLVGGTFTPWCARVHPGHLVRGLARTVEGLGGVIHERTPATELCPGAVVTPRGTVRARTLVRATEAWSASLPGTGRSVVPVYSLMIATEPLPSSVWATIGLAERETFTEHRHMIIYGQRTVDDRIAFGGRGAPYRRGSRIRPEYDLRPAVFTKLKDSLVDILPQVEGFRITHAWGGPLAIPRDWHSSVGLDPATRIGWAGGYVGQGVSTSNLAGRTLADLVLDRDTDVTRQPWVGHRSPPWEPEPLRWIGVNSGLALAAMADAEERLTGRSALLRSAVRLVTGH